MNACRRWAPTIAVAEPALDSTDQEGGAPQTLISHLVELRQRLVRIVIAILAAFAVLTPFAKSIFSTAAKPLIERLPEGTTMIATDVAAPFLTPFKLTFFVAILLTIPITLYQIWAFVAPGLYRKEKKLVIPLMASSTLLFYAGIAFAYFVVFPVVFQFLVNQDIAGVQMQTDISKYLSFMLTLFMAFGVTFEVPIAIMLLVKTGFVTPEKLAKHRPYVVLGAFVIGMLITPPDIISQTLLAVPMLLLFELGLFMAKRFVKPSE